MYPGIIKNNVKKILSILTPLLKCFYILASIMAHAGFSRVELLSHYWSREWHDKIHPSLGQIRCLFLAPSRVDRRVQRGDNKLDRGTDWFSLWPLYKMINLLFWKWFHGYDHHATPGQCVRGKEKEDVLLCIFILILKHPHSGYDRSCCGCMENNNRFKVLSKIWFCHLIRKLCTGRVWCGHTRAKLYDHPPNSLAIFDKYAIYLYIYWEGKMKRRHPISFWVQ